MTSTSSRSSEPLYLDHAASTLPVEQVVEAMMPWLRTYHANPHADHWHGGRAADAVEKARQSIADLIGASPDGIVFTSGATEANNLALKGLLWADGGRRNLWLSDIEHKSLTEPARFLASNGTIVRKLPVTSEGEIEPELVSTLLVSENEGGLVAISHGNNEIGTIQPIAKLSAIAHGCGHLIHVDASQTAGQIPLTVELDGIDSLCLSSHKMYGPAGIGALFLAPGLDQQMQPQLHGGGQQRGIRSGTIAPFLAVGFGVAADISRQKMVQDSRHLAGLAQSFLRELNQQGIMFCLVGHAEKRLPGHLSLQFPGIEAEDLQAMLLPVLSISTGAACAAGELRASHVLRAIGLDESTASQVLRITFGRLSTQTQAINAAGMIGAAIGKIQRRNG